MPTTKDTSNLSKAHMTLDSICATIWRISVQHAETNGIYFKHGYYLAFIMLFYMILCASFCAP